MAITIKGQILQQSNIQQMIKYGQIYYLPRQFGNIGMIRFLLSPSICRLLFGCICKA